MSLPDDISAGAHESAAVAMDFYGSRQVCTYIPHISVVIIWHVCPRYPIGKRDGKALIARNSGRNSIILDVSCHNNIMTFIAIILCQFTHASIPVVDSQYFCLALFLRFFFQRVHHSYVQHPKYTVLAHVYVNCVYDCLAVVHGVLLERGKRPHVIVTLILAVEQHVAQRERDAFPETGIIILTCSIITDFTWWLHFACIRWSMGGKQKVYL